MDSNSHGRFHGEQLEQILGYFTAAKTALASTSHVWHANDMVALAKGHLESLANLNSKNVFIRRALKDQVKDLGALKLGLDWVGEGVHLEFKGVLHELDTTDARVKKTIRQLQATKVAATIQPQPQTPKSLYEFVDEHGADSLMNAFRGCIDATNEAQNCFINSTTTFSIELKKIEDLLNTSNLPDTDRELRRIATRFRSLEAHATDMAQLLESLINHHDLCVTAIKHTEGGLEAAQSAAIELPAGISVDSFHQDELLTPIPPAELAEMMAVLENDAVELESVVQEIRDHSSDLDLEVQEIVYAVETLTNEHRDLNRAMNLIAITGTNLSGYIHAGTDLTLCWTEQKQLIEEKMEELEGLREFYDGFLYAYDGLIAEIGRRNSAKAKMEKVVRDAMSKLDKLYNDDIEERKSFSRNAGDFLPSDIWLGLAEPPPKFEFRLVEQQVPEPLDVEPHAK